MPSPVLPIQGMPAPDLARPTSPGGTPGLFQQVLGGVISGVESSRGAAAEAVGRFLSGEAQEVHTAALAVERAEITLELFLQVRNKVVQAYQEIMRMQL